jgi:HD-like signal output (HDOD) protein
VSGILAQVKKNRATTKDLILAALRERSDMPAMSNTIKVVNEFKKSEDASVSEFANIVLRDYALTTRILKLANSASYAHVVEVTTVSRATILLGMENIKNLALSLMFFDHFQKGNPNVEHIDTMVKSLYSAILAQNIANEITSINEEEVFICSLFHTFGKLLVSFALPEKIAEIKFMMLERGISEDAAALSVLGGRYEEFGVTIAKDFNLPGKIIQSMHKLRGTEITEAAGDADKFNGISFFANEVTNILSTCEERKEMDEKIGQLVTMFRDHFGMPDGRIGVIINASIDKLYEFISVFSVNLNVVPFRQQLLTWKDQEEKAAVTFTRATPADFASEILKTSDIIFESEKSDTPDSIFTTGIQDINSAILSNFSLNNVVSIALETMYRGMQLSGAARALFLIKDINLPVMNVRYGFGLGIEEFKRWFNITLSDSGDIFNIAIVRQKDLVLRDTELPDIKKLLPDWFKSKVFAGIFLVLLPIIIDKKPIGTFYVEGDKKGFEKISASQLNYLKILRDQTVVAIRQKRFD